LLAAEEDWLAANQAEIAAQIEEGWAAAQRGELTDAEQVRAEMLRFKEDWDKQRRPA
jgi:predicted transcriptional regulator